MNKLLVAIAMMYAAAAQAETASEVSKAIQENLMYPKIAQERSINGTVFIKVFHDGVTVDIASGNEFLDRAALAAAHRAFDKGHRPPAGEVYLVPVEFKLVNP